MTKIDLMQFCSLERPAIEEPWSRGGFSYATDGDIIIRIPKLDNIPERAEAPDADILFQENSPPLGEPAAIPDLPPPKYTKRSRSEFFKTRQISGIAYQVKYLRMVKNLPNYEFFPKRNEKPAYFRFQGGDGLLMPCRKWLNLG